MLKGVAVTKRVLTVVAGAMVTEVIRGQHDNADKVLTNTAIWHGALECNLYMQHFMHCNA